ncbi:MAG: DUF1934 domain-containing protein [Lachnospiraceae bacterium]|nr:DUF1934 domain-containing protein [Lachnospiraceae bacterium]
MNPNETKIILETMQCADGNDTYETLEYIGFYRFQNNMHILKYTETNEDNLTTDVRIKATPQKVTVIRKGAVNSTMIFKKDLTNKFMYNNMGMTLDMGLKTRDISISENAATIALKIDYSLVSGINILSQNAIKITIFK